MDGMFKYVLELLEASTDREKEKAYRHLLRIGIDRHTADVMAAEFYSGEVLV